VLLAGEGSEGLRMPTYRYRCEDDDTEFEVWQSITDDALTTHEGCGGRLVKVLSPAGIVLKGSGFYKTDNRGGRSTSKNGDGSKDSGTAKSDGSSPDSSKSDSSGSSDAKGGDAKGGDSKGGGSGGGSKNSGSGSSGSGAKPSNPSTSS
jgi:putative FmdB family regulatory protein